MIENILSLGLGAVLAVIVLAWKRLDDRDYQEALKQQVQDYAELTKGTLSSLSALTDNLKAVRDGLESQKTLERIEQRLLELEKSEHATSAGSTTYKRRTAKGD